MSVGSFGDWCAGQRGVEDFGLTVGTSGTTATSLRADSVRAFAPMTFDAPVLAGLTTPTASADWAKALTIYNEFGTREADAVTARLD